MTDADRRLAIDRDYMQYVSGIRKQQGANTAVPSNRGLLGYMNEDLSISNMLHRYRPRYEPGHNLIRKPVILPTKPRHVQRTGRTPDSIYSHHIPGMKPVKKGLQPLITNPVYKRDYGSYIEMLKERAPVSTKGHQAPPGIVNRPPTKLETAFLRRLPRTMGNNPKYDRASRTYRAQGRGQRLQFAGMRKFAPIKIMQNKLDTQTNVPSVRKFVNNPFVRVRSLANNFAWPTRVSMYARNVAPPLSITTKKMDYGNVGTRPTLMNKTVQSRLAQRVVNFDPKKHVVPQHARTVYGGRLVGRSKVGGEAPRAISVVRKDTTITTQPHAISRPLHYTGERQGLIETSEVTDRILYRHPDRPKHRQEQNTLYRRGALTVKLRPGVLSGRRNTNPTVGSRMTY